MALCQIALLIAIIFPSLFEGGAKARGLEIVFLDVGQGDAAFIRFPEGATMMVDAGGEVRFRRKENEEPPIVEDVPSIGEQVVSKYLWQRGIERLDYIAATHSHTDHIEGFRDLLKNFQVGLAIVSGTPKDDAEFNRFSEAAQRAGTHIAVWKRGDRFRIDGVEIEVLWPPKEPVPNLLDNNQSLVLRLTYGRRSFLLAGDIERQAEREIAHSQSALNCDVLKVPHHGSRTSSTEIFLSKAHPQTAIISAPHQSRFNHPHEEVVERYCRLGIRAYQTGEAGAITVWTDGDELRIEPYAGSELTCP